MDSVTERSVLGAVLLSNGALLSGAIRGLQSEDFCCSAHRQIFATMLHLAECGRLVDIVALCNELSDKGQLERVGGAAYLSDLTTGVVPECAPDHARLVRQRSALRKLTLLGEQLSKKAQERGAEPRVLALWAQEKLVPLRRLDAMPAVKGAQVDAAVLLSDLASFVRSFVVLSPAQADVISLWIAHTHAFEAADVTAYLTIVSAEKRSGKTRLLEVLELLVRDPWFTGRVTAAALMRKVDRDQPTLLLDETDTAFAGPKEYSEALRGLLNKGHSSGGVASVCVGEGGKMDVRDFSTYCPKALAGLGELPDTIADRAIAIRLKRRAPSETVQRFVRREVKGRASELRDRLAAWTALRVPVLRDARPEVPDSLSDRQQEGAEPLLAIADLAGGEWPERARKALLELLAVTPEEDGSPGVRLLADIQAIFEARGTDQLPSADVVAALAELEGSPWPEWRNGKAITPTGVARLLRKYEIGPRNIRYGAKVVKGYERSSFEDAWARYLSSGNPTPEQEPPQPLLSPEPLQAQGVADAEPKELPGVTASVADVAGRCYVHGRDTSWWERPQGGGVVCARYHPPPNGEDVARGDGVPVGGDGEFGT